MYQREYPRPEFSQKVILLREDGKMPRTFDRYESFARRMQ